MKKFFLSSAILSLGLLFTQPLTAQIKVLSNGNVKMGGMCSSTSTDYGLDIGYPKIRIHPAAVAATIAGTAYDIYIYGECSSIGGGGIVGPLSSATPNAALTKCTSFIEGDNLQIGTRQHPVAIYHNLSVSLNSSGVSVMSDRRYKDNIRPMEGGLAQILQLQPVRFDYKRLHDGEAPWDSLARMNKVGFIAQDVEAVVPEAVNHDLFEDFYSLNQTDFIPYIVGGIQELNAIIREQRETIRELTDRIAYLEAAITDQSAPDASFNSLRPKDAPAETVEAAEANRLWSNVPNPFKQETRIRYALTDDVRDAQLCIYDLSGKQLACRRLSDRGESGFTLRAASLQPGIYLYSLIADGKVIDTHRMVVTE
ncbi:MAG: tail fiber domain-containing protein [Bacteroidales bacterium]|nr:tail fiber domain-containing protein [Bacteroidales bacterium]